MTNELQPANQNVCFADLTQNPQRQQANTQLAQVLLDLEKDGVPPSIVAETLFEFLLIEMEPDEPIDVQRAITWYSQLTRFRNSLQSKIDELHQIYDEARD